MTKREAAIVSAYTGILIGEMSDFHKFVEEIMERPVWTHEMGSGEVADEIKKRAKPHFLAIDVEGLTGERYNTRSRESFG